MKTALQELKEALDIEMKERGMLPNWDMYLEKEKEQIKGSFEDGIAEATNEQYGKLDYNMDAEVYYNQEYNQNKISYERIISRRNR
jgi:hypothetical protein